MAGDAELAVRRDLRSFPLKARRGALATSALTLARRIDAPGTCEACFEDCGHPAADPRELAGLVRELRACLADLAAAVPPARESDGVDEVNAKRDQRRAAARRASAPDA